MGVGSKGAIPREGIVTVESNSKEEDCFLYAKKWHLDKKTKENVNKGRHLCVYIFEFIICQRCQTEMEFDTLYS